MSSPTTQAAPAEVFDLPTERDLPFEDGRMRNGFETPQTALLTQTARPVLRSIHGDAPFFVGDDMAIYYRVVRPFAQSKCVAPDWFYVPRATQTNAEGGVRRSYLLWENQHLPLIVIEYASNGGAEERDSTPDTGKFWVYENQIYPAFYAIFVPSLGELEVYELVHHAFVPMRPNEAGRFPIAPMRMELGIWHGTVEQTEADWIRWWSEDGRLLPSDLERAEAERQRAEAAMTDNERLRAMLRSLGHDPDAV